MKGFLAAALCLFALHAHAQTTCDVPFPGTAPHDGANLTWTPPTQNTDGTPIDATIAFNVYEIVGSNYTLQCSTAALGIGIAGLSLGLHSWVVTTTESGSESAYSNTAQKTITPPTPMPPSNLTVDSGSPLAYTIFTTDGAFVAVDVGYVAPNTPCDATQSIMPYGFTETLYHVPESAVSFYPDASAIVTVAKCSGG